MPFKFVKSDELTVLFDLAFVTFKSFAVVSDFDIAHAAITCHAVHVCATSRFFQVSTPTKLLLSLVILAMIQ